MDNENHIEETIVNNNLRKAGFFISVLTFGIFAAYFYRDNMSRDQKRKVKTAANEYTKYAQNKAQDAAEYIKEKSEDISK